MRRLQSKLAERVKAAINRAGFEVRRVPPAGGLEAYKKLYPLDSLENRRFYTVSAGGHYGFGTDFEHPYWTNLDVMRDIPPELRQFNPVMDVGFDLLAGDPLPIESDSAEIILSQFSIEHVPDSSARSFFAESLRSLKEGGILKIVTPNTELDVAAYFRGDHSYFHWKKWKSVEGVYQSLGYESPLTEASLEQNFIAHFATNASAIHAGGNPNRLSDDEVREVMRSMEVDDALDHITSRCCPEIQRRFRENHMSWWSPLKLHRELLAAGFRRVNIVAPWQSNCPVLRDRSNFDRLWNDVATFVEAVK